MQLLKAVVLSVAFQTVWCYQRFPQGFKFGVASSAYQVEGAWNISGKGQSIWDHFTHTNPGAIKNHSTGDISSDSYHHWKRDVQLISELGVQFYRFSISWPRILPTGVPNHINKEGVVYYRNLIGELLMNNIEPMVTMFHWDLPQRLQNLGGWTNPLSAEWFGDYAKVLFSLYGDRVKTWITINEPVIMCDIAYAYGAIAPGIIDPELGMYLCNKHVLLAHATAYRIYSDQFKPKFKGQVSLANHIIWYMPASAEDEELTELVKEYGIGRFCDPVFSTKGGWPSKLEKFIADKSKKSQFPRSRLPTLTQNEIDFLKGTYDFFALNHYTSRVVRKVRPDESIGYWPLYGAPELGAVFEGRDEWTGSGTDWLKVYPEGLRRQLVWIKEQYGDINIIITENGFASLDDDLNDNHRIQYYEGYLKQVLLAIHKDGVNVTGYTAWSLMDSFEWFDGYTTKFGLYNVDFADPNRRRTPRKSAGYYANVIKAHSLNVSTEHKNWKTTAKQRKVNKYSPLFHGNSSKGIKLSCMLIVFVILFNNLWYIL